MSVLAFDFYSEDDPNGTPLGTLDDADCKSMEFRPALHELGSGIFTVSRHHTDATSTLIREDNLVKVRVPSVSTDPIFAFWLKEGDFTLIDTNEQGGEDLTFGGPSLIHILSQARLYHSSMVEDQPNRGSINVPGMWTWVNEPYGAILTRLIEEGRESPFPDAAANGSALEHVTITFDRVNDSDGNPWPDITETFQTPIGSDMLSVAERLSAAGDLYLVMDPDLTLHAYQTYGRDLSGSFGSGTVRFEKGVNILTQLVRKIEARQMITHLLQQDKDGAYSTEVVPGYTSSQRKHWGYFEASQTNDDTQLNKIAQNVIAASRSSGQIVELEFTPGFVPASGRYMPGPEGTDGHFWLGDIVTLHTGSGQHDYNAVDQTVIAFRVVLDEASVDTTDDTAARSLHIVPELNHQHIRGFANELGNPGFCCGPSPAAPTTPEGLTTWEHWTWDDGNNDAIAHPASGSTNAFNGGTVSCGTPSILAYGLTGPRCWIQANTGQQSGYVTVTAGTSYRVTAVHGPYSPTYRLRLEWSTSGGAFISYDTLFNTASPTVWTTSTVTATAPPTAARLRIVKDDGSGTAVAVRFDDVLIQAVGAAATAGDAHPDIVGTRTGSYQNFDHSQIVRRSTIPTVSDDIDSGYVVNTIWVDTTTGRAWVLNSSTADAAEWVELAPDDALALALDDLTDVDAATPSDGDVLTWDNASSMWINLAPASGASALDDLTDVTVPTPSTGEVLTWNGSAWVNGTLPSPGAGAGELLISDTPSTPLVFADILQNEAQDDFLYEDEEEVDNDHGAHTGLTDNDHPQYIRTATSGYVEIFGILRKTGGTWSILDDANHTPVGLSSVSADATKLTVTYSSTFAETGAVSVTVDETWAASYLVGASVGLSSMDIYIKDLTGSAVNPTSVADAAGANIWIRALMKA